MVSSINLFICKNCSKEYKIYSWFIKHTCKTKKLKKNNIIRKKTKVCFDKLSIKSIVPSDTSSCSNWINIFDFTDQYFNEEHSVAETLTDTDIYTDELAKFTKLAGKDIKIMHLNINSLFLKIDEIHAILDTKEFDMVFLNETKLDSFIPNTKVCHQGYNIQRRDRDCSDSIGLGKKGGGLIVYTKKYMF